MIILHAVHVPQESELVVSSPDTDVLLLLVHVYPHFPVSTVFFTGKGRLKKNLPPTSGSLDLSIRRAHYIAMIWRKADENHPHLPAPVAFGWTFDAGSSHFSSVRCLNPPAPEAVLHLIKCGCKTGCEGRCSCRKNNIPVSYTHLTLPTILRV